MWAADAVAMLRRPTQNGSIQRRSNLATWLRDGDLYMFDSCQRYLHEEVGRGSLDIFIARVPEPQSKLVSGYCWVLNATCTTSRQ
jgi:hypothetical protein